MKPIDEKVLQALWEDPSFYEIIKRGVQNGDFYVEDFRELVELMDSIRCRILDQPKREPDRYK